MPLWNKNGWAQMETLMRCQAERDVAVQKLATARQQIEELENQVERMAELLRMQEERPVAQEVAAQLADQLVVVTEATPWWRHLHGLLALEIDQAVNDALVPDLSNDAVNVRRGRAAMLKDFRGLLNNLWLKAQLRRKVER